MRYGSKVLFDEVSTTFSAGRRYGLTGPNGAGKSTFMKLLSGELQPQKGTVTRPARLGILRPHVGRVRAVAPAQHLAAGDVDRVQALFGGMPQRRFAEQETMGTEGLDVVEGHAATLGGYPK